MDFSFSGYRKTHIVVVFTDVGIYLLGVFAVLLGCYFRKILDSNTWFIYTVFVIRGASWVFIICEQSRGARKYCVLSSFCGRSLRYYRHTPRQPRDTSWCYTPRRLATSRLTRLDMSGNRLRTFTRRRDGGNKANTDKRNVSMRLRKYKTMSGINKYLTVRRWANGRKWKMNGRDVWSFYGRFGFRCWFTWCRERRSRL